MVVIFFSNASPFSFNIQEVLIIVTFKVIRYLDTGQEEVGSSIDG